MSFFYLIFLLPATLVFWLIVDLPVTLLGLIMVPLGLLLRDRNSNHLPKLFWLWDNDKDGIDGDAGWQGLDHTNGNYASFWNRFRWLAIRNPSNNWGYKIGFKQTADVTYKYIGDPATSDQGHSGALLVLAYRDKMPVSYAFYMVQQYSMFKSKCLRVFSGWKIHDNIDPVAYQNNLGSSAQFVLVPNPLMTFKKA